MRHNQIRDIEATFMSEVCKDAQREPTLLPLSGETFNLRPTNIASEARLDISARGIWNSVDKTFFDVRVFILVLNPTKPLPLTWLLKDMNKKRKGPITEEFLK